MKNIMKIAIVLIIGIGTFLFAYSADLFPINANTKKSKPLSGLVIVIDPGHGGVDAGANKGKILEKDIALNVAKNLRDYVQQMGGIVIMTREKDKDLAPKDLKGLRKRKIADLEKRVDLINDSDADLYVSIHLNALPDGRWRGARTFYNKNGEENKQLAETIQSQLIKTLENTDREARPIKDVRIVEKSDKTGALVEIGFLSNDEERQLLQNKKYQKKVAFAIYGGITKYLANPQNNNTED